MLRLMKQRTDEIAAKDEKLQQFLMWVNEKSLSVKVPYKPAAVRAFYFALDRARDRALKPKQRQVLQQLKKQLPDPDGNKEIYKQWWKTNGQAWTKQLREMMIWHRNIGHDWQFSEQQQEFLRQYYDANLLLVDCLNSSCNVTPSVRNEIEETLLLPTKMLPNAEG